MKIEKDLSKKVSNVLDNLQDEGKLTVQMRPYVQTYLQGDPVIVDNIPEDPHDHNAFAKAVTQGLKSLGVETSIGIYADQAETRFYIRQDLDGWKQRVESDLKVEETPEDNNPRSAANIQKLKQYVSDGILTEGEARYYEYVDVYNQHAEELNKKSDGALVRMLMGLKEMHTQNSDGSSKSQSELDALSQKVTDDVFKLGMALINDAQGRQIVSDTLSDLGLTRIPEVREAMTYLPDPTPLNETPEIANYRPPTQETPAPIPQTHQQKVSFPTPR